MKLSIIIPVYNVEKYLNRCLDSIINQINDSNVEIIIVDDGSTDSSGIICNNYQSNNVLIKHKKNGGLSSARNYGLKFAKGEYVWFIDSDDFIENGSIKKIIKILSYNKCDVLVINSNTIDDNNIVKKERIYSIREGLYSNQEYMKKMFKNPKSILFCAQYHIVKLSLIKKNKLYFKENIIHEDELWTPQVLINSNYIYYSNLLIYYHYMRSDSIMHSSKKEQSGLCDLIVSTELYKIFDSYKERDLKYMRDRCTNIFLQSVWKVKNFFNINIIKKSIPLKNSLYLKTKAKALLYFISPHLYLMVHKILRKN